jgi:hypothetical protein
MRLAIWMNFSDKWNGESEQRTSPEKQKLENVLKKEMKGFCSVYLIFYAHTTVGSISNLEKGLRIVVR